MPGDALPVFGTDFGRVGIQICYDIGWPATLGRLGAAGAEVVVWPSAYDGGFPLQTYAWRNQYYVASSVWTHFAHLYDITGRSLAATTRSTRLVAQQVDLEKTLFHTDDNLAKLPAIRAALGRAVEVVRYSEENYFTLECRDPAWPVARIAREFQMETHREYHARATRVQDAARGSPPCSRRREAVAPAADLPGKATPPVRSDRLRSWQLPPCGAGPGRRVSQCASAPEREANRVLARQASNPARRLLRPGRRPHRGHGIAVLHRLNLHWHRRYGRRSRQHAS